LVQPVPASSSLLLFTRDPHSSIAVHLILLHNMLKKALVAVADPFPCAFVEDERR